MQEELSDKTKISMLIIISVVVILLAILVYFYQNNELSTSADVTYRSPSTLCVTGKMKVNGNYVSDYCFYSDNERSYTASDDVALEIEENYTVTYTMGDFVYINDSDTSYQAPYQKCALDTNSDALGWNYYPDTFDASLATILGVAVNEPIFDPLIASQTSVISGHNFLSSVDYRDAPNSTSSNLDEFQYINKYNLVSASGVESMKEKGHDYTFDSNISCRDSVGEQKDIYYGGAHQPGDFVSLSFTPNVTKTNGEMLGYTANDSSLTPNLNGNLIDTKYKVVANLDDYNYDQASIIKDADTDHDGIIDSKDADIDGDGILNIDESTYIDSSSYSDLINKISTGASLWFNLLIAFLIILTIWYFMFRRKIFKH